MVRFSLLMICSSMLLVGSSDTWATARIEPGTMPEQDDFLQEALDTAIDDERHAIAFYSAVMKTHGERRPFSNIIRAERRHEAALLQQYTRLGLTAPTDRWQDHAFDVPKAFADACDASAVAEVRNVKIYENLKDSVEDQQVLAVFENLRWASAERHLPAFRRHGNGWETLAKETLTDAQRRQHDAAMEAQQSMFKALFSELSEAIRQDGAVNAIDVCATRAPMIAAEQSAKLGVRIGRTSWKLRNQDNKPPIWADLAIDDRPSDAISFADRSGRLGTLSPIRLAANCLQCHGAPDNLAPGVADALARRYPQDQATGFAEGDLRGWFWVEVPAPVEQE